MSSYSQQYNAAKNYGSKQLDYAKDPSQYYKQPDGCCYGSMVSYWIVALTLILLVISILIFWGIASSVDDGEDD